MTHLRQLMLDELQRRNYSPNTVRSYVHAVEEFARHFRRSPEQLGPDHIRDYQVHLFRDRKLSPRTIEGRTAALRFLFVKTLRRPYLPDAIPFPKQHKRLPTVLSQEEVARLIDATGNLMHRAMVMTLYLIAGLSVLILMAVLFSKNPAKPAAKMVPPVSTTPTSEANQRNIERFEQDLTAKQRQVEALRKIAQESTGDADLPPGGKNGTVTAMDR